MKLRYDPTTGEKPSSFATCNIVSRGHAVVIVSTGRRAGRGSPMDEKVQKIFRKRLQNMIVRERGMIQVLPEEDKDVMELLDRVSTVGLCAASNCSTLLGRNNFTICLGDKDNPRRRST